MYLAAASIQGRPLFKGAFYSRLYGSQICLISWKFNFSKIGDTLDILPYGQIILTILQILMYISW